MTDTMITARTERRLQLRARGYLPIPLHGKVPPMKAWQSYTVISCDMLVLWSKVFPLAENTGILTRYTPTLDLDILNEEAAVAVEDMIRERYEERGYLLVRIGRAPKRAILFRTNTPFRKITAPLIAPNGITDEKVELLADGQQVVVHGRHPHGMDYRWHGGVPWDIAHADLPYLHEQEAHQLVEDIVKILISEFSYQRASPPRSIANGRGGATREAHSDERWYNLLDNILLGRVLHDSFRDLAAMLAASGMNSGAATHLLQALGEQIEPYDARVEARLRDIPRAIDSAYAKYAKR
jgi:hypothetical protein